MMAGFIFIDKLLLISTVYQIIVKMGKTVKILDTYESYTACLIFLCLVMIIFLHFRFVNGRMLTLSSVESIESLKKYLHSVDPSENRWTGKHKLDYDFSGKFTACEKH